MIPEHGPAIGETGAERSHLSPEIHNQVFLDPLLRPEILSRLGLSRPMNPGVCLGNIGLALHIIIMGCLLAGRGIGG